MKSLFTLNPSTPARLLGLILVSIVLMVSDHRYQQTHLIRSTIGGVLYPLERLVSTPGDISKWLAVYFTTRASLQSQVESLERLNLFQQARLQELAQLKLENNRLRELLDSPLQRNKNSVLLADIIRVNLHPFRKLIAIDRGQQDNVYEGQAIVGAQGIIGQVVEVFPMHSNVLLISDPSHALLAENNRTGLRALLVGSGEADRVYLQNISSSADIQIGDLFQTSGLDGLYPRNYPVARVLEIGRVEGEAFLTVTAKPLAQLDSIREVLLLWPEQRIKRKSQPIGHNK
ncbi:MAG: rod shape-determining protein MreC [Gammaproteobacteria bacterium]|jgi:rod shape-determining protein MreC|nr:rod shape-determining protein MreC [Gammaproteobacteria bacterium]